MTDEESERLRQQRRPEAGAAIPIFEHRVHALSSTAGMVHGIQATYPEASRAQVMDEKGVRRFTLMSSNTHVRKVCSIHYMGSGGLVRHRHQWHDETSPHRAPSSPPDLTVESLRVILWDAAS